MYTAREKSAGEQSHAVVHKTERTQVEYYDHSIEGGAKKKPD
jgi:hypothetical protein